MTAVRQKNAPQVALVTGGEQPLGRAIGLAMAAEGWDVVIVCDSGFAIETLATDSVARPAVGSVTEPAVRPATETMAAGTAASEIRAMGRRAIVLDCVLEDADAVSDLVGRAIAGLGSVGCIINAAAMCVPDDIGDFVAEMLWWHMQINVQAPLLLAQALHAATPAGTQAVVINLIGQQTGQPAPQALSHSLSAAALEAATRMLAQALAPTVRVLGVAAGIAIAPEEIAGAVCFLARASALTGHTLQVDGGQHLRPSSSTPLHNAA